MRVIPAMWILWAALTTALLILLLYRNSLTRNEEDQLFLEPSGEGHKHDQEVLLEKVHRVEPAVRIAEISTAVMTVAIAGFYLWDLVKRIAM